MRQLAHRKGLFGHIRILERLSDGARLYLIGRGLQTMTSTSGESLFGYVHALKLLLRQTSKILLIGGAGGSLATMLARRGCKVTIVDIDPVAKPLAEQFFSLDPRVKWITADALTYLKHSRSTFDAIVVDACDARNTVPDVRQPEWLLCAARRLRPNGRLLLNLAGENGPPEDGLRLAEAMADRGFHAVLLRPEDGWEGNELLQLTRSGMPAVIDTADILARPAEARTYLLSLRTYSVAPRPSSAA